MLAKQSRNLVSALALFAATLAVSGSVHSDNRSSIGAQAHLCVQSTDSSHVTALDCPEFFSLLALDSGWFAQHISVDEKISRADLVDLHRLSTPPEAQPSRWNSSAQTLDGILKDYKDLKSHEPNAVAEFFDWLAGKLDNSEFGKQMSSWSDVLRLPAGILAYMLYAFAALLGAAALLAVFVVVRTILLSASPRGMYGASENPHIRTGDERGNAPVLTLTEIRQLSGPEQPAALLVAAVDYFRGTLLPDNPWAATNAEISKTVAAGDSSMARPLETLINNAERTLYGEMPVSGDQIDASFQAATTILGSKGPAALNGGDA